jgi:hypothetical protein
VIIQLGRNGGVPVAPGTDPALETGAACDGDAGRRQVADDAGTGRKSHCLRSLQVPVDLSFDDDDRSSDPTLDLAVRAQDDGALIRDRALRGAVDSQFG